MVSCGVIFLVLLVLSNTVWIEAFNHELKDHFLENLEETFTQKPNRSEEDMAREIHVMVSDFVHLGRDRAKRVRRDTKSRASAHFNLVGFEDLGSIPVSFPLDLCLMNVLSDTFAVALHTNGPESEKDNSSAEISFFRLNGTEFTLDHREKLAKSYNMDCIVVGNLAFVAVAGELRRENLWDIGSPVFRINPQDRTIRSVHFDRMEHQLAAKFWSHGNDIFLMKTFRTSNMAADIQAKFLCPIYKWNVAGNFELWNGISCSNTVAVEVFGVNEDTYLAMANGLDEKKSSKTPSVIYRLDETAQKFVYQQGIVTNGAVDVKHFRAGDGDFLVVANSATSADESRDDLASHSIIYKHANGQFLPIQSITTDDVSNILPVTVSKDQVILLFSSQEAPIKIFEYDGWKFYESSVKYSGESFDTGVTRMREYRFGQYSVIVIANKRVFGETQNIFTPQVKPVPNYDIYEEMLKWCEESLAELTNLNLEEAVQMMDELPKITDEEIVFKGVEFASLEVESVETKAMKTPEIDLDEETVKKINAISQKVVDLQLKMSNIDETLRIFQETDDQQLAQQLQEELTQLNLEYDEVFADEATVEFLNGLETKHLVHTDEPLNLPNVNLKCANATISGDLNIANLTDLQKFNSSSPDTLIVENLQVQSINSLNFSTIQENAKKMNLTVIKADNLIVNGLVNGEDLSVLEKYALRTEGNQMIAEVASIDHLVAKHVNVFRKISGRDFSDLVLADEGDFKVPRVSFLSNFSVEVLNVTEKLSQIMVFNGQLDVVLTNSTEKQIIEGKKTFSDVKLQKPIVLRGKIKSESLDKMNPMASINENVVLEGDYFITGPVTVKRVLKIGDLLSGENSLSLRRLFVDGLRKDAQEIHQDINFQQPLKVSHLDSESINGIDPENLVRMNTEESQKIVGKKFFRGNLMVNEGFCDAGIIQGVNLTELNQTVLHRSGDEMIEGDIQFRKITANSVRSEETLFAGKDFAKFLHFDKEQRFSGRVTMRKPISVRKNLTIGDINSSGKVSGVNISDFVTDTARKGERLTLTGKKIFVGGLAVGDLHGDHLPGLNISHIDEQFFAVVDEKIFWNFVEFPNETIVREMMFLGRLNKIQSSDFGNCWLLTEGDQELTAPQVFSTLSAQEGVNLRGFLNGRNFEKLIENSFFINRHEYLPALKSLDRVTLNDALWMNGSLSGVFLPELLTRKGRSAKILPKFTVFGDLIVDKNLWIRDSINNISLTALLDFIRPPANVQHRLFIHGDAHFNSEPKVDFLNDLDILNAYENALRVYNKLDFTEFVHLHEAEFLDRVFLAGMSNGINLTYVAENYLSCTKAQEISTKVNFLDTVTLNVPLSSDQMHLEGRFRGMDSDETVKIEELDERAAKMIGNQTISGQWRLKSVIVEGDLENSRINGLNVEEDLLRYDVERNNVTGLKRLHHLVAENVKCGEKNCLVQGVNVVQWFADAVFLIGNHTIHDTVTLKRAVFHTDITVHGRVNNITFDRDTVLTKDCRQVIQGNVYIDNRSKDRSKLHSLTLHRLNATRINGKDVEDFLTNVALQSDGANPVESLVVFEKPLVVENLQCRGNLFGMNMSGRQEEMEMAQELSVLERKLKRLYEKAQTIVKHQSSDVTYVDSFRVAQTLTGVLKKIVPIELLRNGKMNLYLAILAGQPKETIINFYRLEEFQRKTFVESDIPSIRFANEDFVSIDRLHFLGQDFLFTEKHSLELGYTQTIFHYVHDKIKVIYERFSRTPRRIAVVRQEKQECIVEYSVKDFQVSVECLVRDSAENITWKPYQRLTIHAVRELMALKTNVFAALTTNGSVSILEHRPGEKWQEKQALSIINPLDMSSETFEGKLYLAVCSGQTKNSVHHGSVEIFRHVGKKFVHFQHIPIEASTRIQFSVLPSGQFMLYALTGNPGQPLIVYIYAGMSGFRQFAVASTIPKGNRLTVIKVPKFRKEFVAVLSASEATLVEAVIR
ncbi:uncharacterized protein LOC132258787 [Phlebotomus argentipes]|uniref:uncharacterized protein LOC132258787 n=1 Tax=Phlebotomus argentipes TaxID=94469 RepID=UPI00289347EE|nr:uncharacterized protein LOC132258787 [Phlebotomus argentipes]